MKKNYLKTFITSEKFNDKTQIVNYFSSFVINSGVRVWVWWSEIEW